MIDAEDVRRRTERVKQRIADAGGDAAHVGIVAVTKGFDSSAIEAAARAGLVMIGENYAQELHGKWHEVDTATKTAVEIHFIGRLQSNKVRQLAGVVDVWQSVDRMRLVSEIARHDPGASIFVQLDVSGSATQGGCPPGEASSLVAAARREGLDVAGCMAVGPQGSASEIARAFSEVARFSDLHEIEHRCMGMSGDLEEAVRAGSTMVRIGTALFGNRPPRSASARGA
ncbi:YggS family pyridoxal phosphate-dependent enzyme [Candidatus Poriferisodalis sp.]|uniref:YggS family pyridoxal phosphate-dependent enzyme n=1 Tax=Candidatus Poriferisodalis sp. TaxID=3101277 RepID=UPI003B01A79A